LLFVEQYTRRTTATAHRLPTDGGASHAMRHGCALCGPIALAVRLAVLALSRSHRVYSAHSGGADARAEVELGEEGHVVGGEKGRGQGCVLVHEAVVHHLKQAAHLQA
jgi:hypothetical protein